MGLNGNVQVKKKLGRKLELKNRTGKEAERNNACTQAHTHYLMSPKRDDCSKQCHFQMTVYMKVTEVGIDRT